MSELYIAIDLHCIVKCATFGNRRDRHTGMAKRWAGKGARVKCGASERGSITEAAGLQVNVLTRDSVCCAETQTAH